MTRKIIVHPFLFAVHPVLFLCAQNTGQILARQVMVNAGLLVLLTCLLWWLTKLLSRNLEKAALITSCFVLLFFSYGHFYSVFGSVCLPVLGVLRFRHLLIVLAVVFGGMIYLFLRKKSETGKWTAGFNVMGCTLLLISIVKLGVFAATGGNSRGVTFLPEEKDLVPAATTVSTAQQPNIFFIILDAYGREDVLREIYKYDNSDFLNALKQRGFFIAGKSRSNYCQTLLSVTTLLNFDYGAALLSGVKPDCCDNRPAEKMIFNSRMFRFAKQRGYRTYAYATGYYCTSIKSADVYRSQFFSLDNFQMRLLGLTPIEAISREMSLKESSYQLDLHRRRILWMFDKIPEIDDRNQPALVFGHIITPHPPFVFNSSGEAVTQEYGFSLVDGNHYMTRNGCSLEEYRRRYKAQLEFINKKILVMVDRIRKELSRPSVIILQADHGPRSMLVWESLEKSRLPETFGILNACYFPGNCSGCFYDEISPVNTSRLILKRYFGSDIGLLKDESYFSSINSMYKFTNVTEMAKQGN